MRKSPVFLLCAAALLLCGFAAAAQAGGFLPHRAVYVMKLDRAREGAGIAGVAGRMAVQWTQDCQGWTFEHRSTMNIALAEGAPLQLGTQVSTWESTAGDRYSFTLRHLSDGKETERVEGTATLGPDGSGVARFTRPKPREYALPRGTLFPIAHSELVLGEAKGLKGAKTLSRVVFDGMGEEGPLEANAVLTRRDAAPGAPLAPALAGMRPFAISIAYFEPAAAASEPKHEMGMRLYDNGVVDRMTIQFDEFSVLATLERVEMLVPATCPPR
jgi:hypothetical protein